jgi:hypothetical protein
MRPGHVTALPFGLEAATVEDATTALAGSVVGEMVFENAELGERRS